LILGLARCVRKLYAYAVGVNPAFYAKYEFAAYMKFLTEQNLLTQPAVGQYQITVKGRTFLLFMVNTGKPHA